MQHYNGEFDLTGRLAEPLQVLDDLPAALDWAGSPSQRRILSFFPRRPAAPAQTAALHSGMPKTTGRRCGRAKRDRLSGTVLQPRF